MDVEKIRVLLVEDDAIGARRVGAVLERAETARFELRHVDSSAGALNALRASALAERAFDVVLLDLMLPDSEGLETFYRIRDQAPGLPILILTDKDDEGIATRAVRDGAQDYLVKTHIGGDSIIRSLRYAVSRTHAERRVRETEERLRMIVNNAPIVLFAFDREGRFTLAEGMGLLGMGLKPGQLLGLPAREVCGGTPWILESMKRALRGEAHSVVGMADDHEYDARYTPIRDENGTVTGAICVASDVTEQREAEWALGISEERYRNLFEGHPQPMWVFERESLRFLAVNEAAISRYGYSRDAFLRMGLSDILPHDGSRNGLLKHRKKDGSCIEVEASEFEVVFDGRKATLVLLSDVTAKRRAEKVVQLLLETTMAINEARDLVAALELVLSKVCDATGWLLGQAWTLRSGATELECGPIWPSGAQGADELRDASVRTAIAIGKCLPGRAWATRQPYWSADVSRDLLPARREAASRCGIKAGMSFPVLAKDELVAVIEFFVREPRVEDEPLVNLVSLVAAQLGAGIQRKKMEDELRRQAVRQARLTKLGLAALGNIGLEALMEEAALLAVRSLDVEFAQILELLPGGETFQMKAGSGWKEGVIGHVKVDAALRTPAAHALSTHEPVVIADLSRDSRFDPAPHLVEHGVLSGVVVVIRGSSGPYGVLSAHSTRRRAFSREDGQFLQAVANALSAAIERERALDGLRRSEMRFRSLIEHSPEAIFVHRKGVLVYANPRSVSYLGYRDAQLLLGKQVLELMHPEDRELVKQRIREVTASRTPTPPREFRFVREHSGEVLVAECISLPIEFDGQPSIAVVARDVTERRRLQTRLILTDRLTSLGTLAAGVAHEINNPLSYVIANLEKLLSDLPVVAGLLDGGAQGSFETMGKCLREAREGAERVRRIVKDLRTFSRSGAEERPELVDVRAVVESSVNISNNEIRHRAKLVREYGEAPTVSAHESRLGQVVINLLVNAAQAIPDGMADRNTIIVSTRTDSKGQAVIEVSDTGCGIPKDVLERLFDPFFTTKPPGVGTGLGLSICHSIVSGYGGKIEVESAVGKGSVFRVVLPPAKRAPAAESTGAPASNDRPSRRGRVLIVDDEPLLGEAVKRILESEHEVEAVTSASVALDRLREGTEFDVIICDLMMPVMTGMDFHQELQSLSPAHAGRVIFMTGGVFTERARIFLESIPNPHLEKPFDARHLRALVRERLTSLGPCPSP